MKRKIKVIIKANGGNDGLNTLIPIGKYSEYIKARPKIGIPENMILRLDDRFGLHPALYNFYQMFADGQLSIINNVGMKNPDFSHFRAMDIYSTASRSDQYFKDGWIGRSINPNIPPPTGIKIGAVPSLDFVDIFGNPTGLTITDPKSFVDFPDGVPPSPGQAFGRPAHIANVRRMTESQSKVVAQASAMVVQQITYPDTDIANQLKIIARLIAGGLPATTYMATMTGFDTHADQVTIGLNHKGQHANLLEEMGNAIAAFIADLKFLDVTDEVVGIVISEFGREVAENGTAGTDHGHAAPVFVFGTALNSNRILGNIPDLSGNIVPMEYDFRQVYRSLLNYTGETDFKNDTQPLPIFTSTKNKLVEIHLGATGKTYTIFDDETLEVKP
jgi:uncharacterized protein (DUF1501 family)